MYDKYDLEAERETKAIKTMRGISLRPKKYSRQQHRKHFKASDDVLFQCLLKQLRKEE